MSEMSREEFEQSLEELRAEITEWERYNRDTLQDASNAIKQLAGETLKMKDWLEGAVARQDKEILAFRKYLSSYKKEMKKEILENLSKNKGTYKYE